MSNIAAVPKSGTYVLASQMQASVGRSAPAATHLGRHCLLMSHLLDRPVTGWAVPIGAPFGTFLISLQAESMSDWLAVSERLTADPEYEQSNADAAEVFDAYGKTHMSSIVSTTGAPLTGRYLAVTTATMRDARTTDALSWSCDVLEHLSEVGEAAGTLTASTAGVLNRLAWSFALDSAEHLDRFANRTRSDPGYVERLDEMDDLFVEASGRRVVLGRLDSPARR